MKSVSYSLLFLSWIAFTVVANSEDSGWNEGAFPIPHGEARNAIQLDHLEEMNLPGLTGACSVPQWSAEGNYLAVQVQESDTTTLTGTANKIQLIDFSEFNRKLNNEGLRPTTKDLKVYTLSQPADDLFGGGAWSDYSVEWCPAPAHEKEFIFIRSSGSGYDLYKATFSTRGTMNPVPISHEEGWEEYPDWINDLIVYSLGAELKIANSRGEPQIVKGTDPAKAYFYPSWKNAGRKLKLAYAARKESDKTWNLYIADVDDNTSTLSHEKPLINRSGNESWTYSLPEWSPSLNKVAFYATDNNQTYQVWVADVSGDARRVGRELVETVVGKEYSFIGPAWSADGTKLVFFARPDRYSRPQLTCYDVSSSASRPLTVNGPPDPPSIGKPHQVSCSPAGNLLAFVDLDTRKLWIALTNLKGK